MFKIYIKDQKNESPLDFLFGCNSELIEVTRSFHESEHVDNFEYFEKLLNHEHLK
jgi:hypothetical protein